MRLRRPPLTLPAAEVLRRRLQDREELEAAATPAQRRVRPPREDATTSVAWPLRVAAAWSWRAIVVGFAVYVAIMLTARLTLIAYSLLIALLLAALLHPAVSLLRRLGAGRALSAVVVFIAGIAVLGGIFAALVNALLAELPDIGDQASEGLGQVREWLVDGPIGLQQSQVDDYLQQAQDWFDENQSAFTSGALDAAGVVGNFAGGIFLTLFITYFFLYDGDRIWDWTVRLLPDGAENPALGAGRRAWTTLGGYVRGVVVVATIDAVGIGIILFVLGVPLALPLSILVFFGAFVPLVGALVTGAVAVLVALVTQGPIDALIVLGGILLVQQIEGNVLQPLIMSRFVRLHPLAVILAVTAGGLLAGIGGAVVAVPIVAVINVVVRYLSAYNQGELEDRTEDLPVQATGVEPAAVVEDRPDDAPPPPEVAEEPERAPAQTTP